jgi:hypothetical protein
MQDKKINFISHETKKVTNKKLYKNHRKNQPLNELEEINYEFEL